jgi:hypothetical protein
VLTPEQQKRIIEELQKRNATPVCRCGRSKNFLLMDGLFLNLLGDGKNLVIGGPAIPTVAVVCDNCGAIYQYAVGTLGLLKDLGLSQ